MVVLSSWDITWIAPGLSSESLLELVIDVKSIRYTHLAVIKTRSFTAYDVTDTAPIKNIAANTVICLN